MGPRRSAERARRFAGALLVLGMAACAQTTQLWPPPPPPSLAPGALIAATFATPRTIAAGGDSVIVSELNGRVVAVRNDSVVVNLRWIPGSEERAALSGRDVAFALDSAVHVTRTTYRTSPGMIAILSAMALLLAATFRLQ